MSRAGRVLLVACVIGASWGVGHAVRASRPAPPRPAAVADGKEDGLRFRLSEGTARDTAGSAPVARPGAEPLDPARTRQLLDALPPLPVDPTDQKDFALRDKSLPPPRTGRTTVEPFPPASSSEKPDTGDPGPLTVLRHQPENDVPLAPSLSVTFSQPMVAVTAHDDLAREAVPVRITPEPAGRWRWVGTRTLFFEPVRAAQGETAGADERGRFPMATEYTVEIPAGTRSATGGALAAPVRWTFRTPPPRLVGMDPVNRSTVREPILFASFDQRIDRAAVLPAITVKAGGAAVPVRLATGEEIEADATVAALARAAVPGRWLAFRPVAPLPAATEIEVVVGPGTPSAEGPRKATEPQGWSFSTYGPLTVVRQQCGWNDKCPPRTPWTIWFSNALDLKAFSRDQVRVTPEVPALRVNVNGNVMTVQGRTRGRTRYTVTLDAGLKDAFGQTLGKPTPLTFTTTEAEPQLWSSMQGLVVLDPAAPPALSVFTTNHTSLEVRAHAVTPGDWPAFQAFMQQAWRDDRKLPLPGRSVLRKTVPVAGEPDELAETRVDLSGVLPGGLGHVVVEIEPTVRPKGRGRDAVRAWVQGTRLGLTAFADGETLLGWVTSLGDGKPVAEAEVLLGPSGAALRSDVAGLVRLPLGDSSPVLVARKGGDVAILPHHPGWWGGEGWSRRPPSPYLRAFVFDDRGMYKPGEEARLKGWLKVVEPGPTGDLAPSTGVTAVDYVLSDPQGNEVLRGSADVDAWGGFDVTLALPGTMNLGHAQLRFTARGGIGGTFAHALQVQEFRRPEFEVGATAEAGPHVVGGHTTVTARASYYAGGALPDAEVRWDATARPGQFTPPNRGDYTFGSWIPWWVRHEPGGQGGGATQSLTSRTGSDGSHVVRLDFDGVQPARPSQLEVQATITDVNRQAWTATAQLLVHPSLVYVGLRTSRPFVQAGQAIQVEGIAVDLDGAMAPGRPVVVEAVRLDWEQTGGEWREVEKDAQRCERTSGGEPFRCEFVPREGGSWRVRARVTDAQDRPNESELRLWVAGGDVPPSRGLSAEELTLVPDRKDYKPGDTAEVLVVAPFAPAEGVLTLRRSGLVRSERFRMTGATHTLRIPIESALTPNVWVQVDLVGATVRAGHDGRPDPKLKPRPAYATGQVELRIPPADRALAVTVTPREKGLDPGAASEITLEVKDAAGRPVPGAQVALVVADEAVLALSGYKLPDPMAVFYAARSADVYDRHLRQHLILANPDQVEGGVMGGAVGGVEERVEGLFLAADAAMSPPPPPAAQAAAPGRMRMVAKSIGRAAEAEPMPTVVVRSDFRPLAHFDPSVVTDAAGKATVTVKLPESLTRFRLMGVAADAQGPGQRARFGSAESTVTVRLPLMVRPSPPRFLNFGDRFELPVVLQNQTDAPLSVDVAVRASNAEPAGGEGRRVQVPANDRVEVRFPAAAGRPGTARFQVVAVSGQRSDAAVVSLPVWTPATTEAFATYGQIDAGVMVQPVRAPSNVVPQFGGLEVTTSSTALQALTDAVLYLVAYPFECTEQMSSRLMAVAALRDVLAAFEAKGLPPPQEILAAVERDVKMLQRLQNQDGGWSFWRRGDESWPYVSIHVAHALQRAKAKGFEVPQPTLDASKNYLEHIEQHIPSWYGPEARRTLVAYALYVRRLMGDRDAAKAREVIREAGGVTRVNFEALGFLLSTMTGDPGSAHEIAEIRRHVGNNVTETAAAANFVVDYGDAAHLLLYSNRRADAILLEALIADQPTSDLIPKLVTGLLAHRKAGRWENTQENAFVLLALDRYFQAYEKVTPDFVARVWLGERYAGEQAFRGRSTDRKQVNVPMATLLEAQAADLVIQKEGAGRLYYRIGLQYAPASLKLAPADHGFTVERAYEGVDAASDVRRDEDGTWRIKAGSRVRVRVTMVANARRYHVALVDPLPAGLEALNPALAVTGRVPPGAPADVHVMGAPGLGGPGRGGHFWWWRTTWYEHQNLRDERVEAFTSLLWEGVWTYDYVARATTPGRFVVPPPKAEEMYHPETFGRGATAIVVVE